MSYNTQGRRLRNIREKSGFTQQHIASALNVDRSTYASYEIGRSQPNLNTLIALAKIFNTTLDDLLDDDLVASYVSDIGRQPNGTYTTAAACANRAASHSENDSHVYDLSKDEKALLCFYRAASDQMRKQILEQTKVMLRQGTSSR